LLRSPLPEYAMEMGAVAVLVNTAIASDPVRMAQAFKKAIEAGREAREIGLGEQRWTASATSPLTEYFFGSDTVRLKKVETQQFQLR
jgi:thiazole synthase ThiGH ThiG subunit